MLYVLTTAVLVGVGALIYRACYPISEGGLLKRGIPAKWRL